MANHLASIGFPVETIDDFRALADRVADKATALEVVDGYYLHWSSDCGAELWLQLDRDEHFIGMAPHFRGTASQRVAITERVRRIDDSDLDGAFKAWANPAREDPEQGDYPFVFDSPDYALYRLLSVPVRVDIQMAAFAHELEAYPSAAAFEAAQKEEPRLSSNFFIPVGLFVEGDGMPEAQAMFAATVLEVQKRKNPLTNREFVWVHARTLGGDVDVVCEPSRVQGNIVVGGIVRGAFWLSARISEFEQSDKRGFQGAPLSS